MFRGKLLIVLLLVLVPSAALASTRPVMFRIGYMPEAPAIDGVINDDEWARASSLTGITWPPGNNAIITDNQAVFWFGWNEDHLFFAARSYQRPGIEPNYRPEVPGDNIELAIFPLDAVNRVNEAYRLYLVPEDIKISSAGRMQHIQERPSVLIESERLKGWEPEIETKSRRFADPDNTYGAGTEVWEIEMKLNRQDFDIEPANKAGHVWSWLVARNYANPSMQPHLPIRGDFFNAHGFSWGTVSSDEELTVQLRSVFPLLRGKNGVNLRIFNPLKEDAEMSIRVVINDRRDRSSMYERTRAIVVPAGQSIDIEADEKLEGVRANQILRIEMMVRGPENIVYLDYRANYKISEELLKLSE